MSLKNLGYTKGEIATIVAMIAILALSFGWVLNFWRKQANDARKAGDISKIRSVLDLYYDKHSEYPASLFNLVEEGFLDVLPVPGTGSKEYIYVPLGDNHFCTNFHLGAAMEVPGSSYLNGDKDAYKKRVCDKAVTDDFDGTATNCLPDGKPQGVKADMCYDLEAI
jgi:type II secretory pathway pseudopilin PulG